MFLLLKLKLLLEFILEEKKGSSTFLFDPNKICSFSKFEVIGLNCLLRGEFEVLNCENIFLFVSDWFCRRFSWIALLKSNFYYSYSMKSLTSSFWGVRCFLKVNFSFIFNRLSFEKLIWINSKIIKHPRSKYIVFLVLCKGDCSIIYAM